MSVAAFLLALVNAASAAGADAGRFERIDPRFDALVPPGARLERVAEGFHWVEGPAWDSRAKRLLFSDIPANAIYEWRDGEPARVFLERSGYEGRAPFAGPEPGSNGLTWDAEGRLVICEHGNRRITRLNDDGRRTVLAARYAGRRLNSPNDAVYRANGDLYFTDPPFGLPGTFTDPARELPFSGAYRLRAGGMLELLTDEIVAPNGIAFSPDERVLYLTDVDPERPAWLAYAVNADGSLGAGRVLFDAGHLAGPGRGAPDGLDVDAAGHLFGAGPGGVFVFAPDGTHLGTIVTGVPTSNVEWGDDGSVLYITAGTALYRLRTATRGARFADTGGEER